MAVVNELITKFSFMGSLQPQQDFNRSSLISIKNMAKLAAGIGGAAAAYTAWTKRVIGGLDPMAQLAKSTGVTVENLQELQYAASVSGSSADKVAMSLQRLSYQIGMVDAGMGRYAGKTMDQLGVKTRDANGDLKDAAQILDEMRQGMMGMSMTEKISIAQRLGVDPELVQLLSRTNEEMDAIRKTARDLGVVTTQQAEALIVANDAWTTLKFGLTALKNEIALGFAPQLQKMAERWTSWVKDIRGTALHIIRRLGLALGWVAEMASKHTGKLIALGAAIALAFSPVTRVIAAMTTLYLLVDDLVVAYQGGQSAVRRFFQEFWGVDITPVLRGAVEGVKAVWESVKEGFAPLRQILSTSFGDLVEKLREGDWAGAWGVVTDGAASAFSEMLRLGEGFAQKLGDMIGVDIVGGLRWAFSLGSAVWQGDFRKAWKMLEPQIKAAGKWFMEAMEPVFRWLSDKFKRFIDEVRYQWKNLNIVRELNPLWLGDVGEFIGEGAAKLFIGATGGARPPISTRPAMATAGVGDVNQSNTMNIYTSDPEAAGKAAGRSLSDGLRRAQELQRGRLR